MEQLDCDVCVVGMGSGGVGAALAAARRGARVIAVERNEVVGGTSTMAWVHVWQPVSGASGLPAELWQRMCAIPRGTMRRPYEEGEPGGKANESNPLVYEPWALDWVVREALAETGRCELLLGSSLVSVAASGGDVQAIRIQRRGEEAVVRARVFVDCTGDGDLCAQAGAEWHMGEDPRSLYGESLAPEQASPRVNAMTLVYRLRDTGTRQEPWLPPDTPPDYCTGGASMCLMPNGDLLVNRVGMLSGDPLDRRGWPALVREAHRRAHAHAYWMQTEKGYETWALAGIAPEVGVRESRRIMGQYVLTEHDCRAGAKGQNHPDIVAISDHTFDLHGPVHYDLEMSNGPYGIPFRCLRPRGFDNLLIACRAASFSHVAATTCRLQRTMIKLGEAAGTAAALAIRDGVALDQVETPELQAELVCW